MNKNKVLEVLEEDSFPIAGEYHTSININQSGTLNQDKLRREQELYLKLLTSWMAPHLIEKKQYYPHDDIAEVVFSADFVIMERTAYDYIKSFVESLIETKEIMNHE